ncbi:MAG: PfkB family carbohydrate kinase [Atribacterota bacterium]
MVLVVTPNPCLDRTLFVDAHRPSGRVEVQKATEIAGGKGSNVCRVLKELGVPCVHLVPLGGYTGERVFHLLTGEGIATVPVWIRSATRVVTTVVDRQWHQIVYFEPPHEMEHEEKREFLTQLTALQENADFVLFCGSLPPSFPEFYEEALPRCQGKSVIIDGRGEALRTLSSYPFGVKMNAEEAEVTLGKPLQKPRDWEAFFDFFFTRGAQIVILTLGKDGAVLGRKEGFLFAQPPEIPAVNPVGSGDAFLAGFIYGLLRWNSFEEAMRLGTAAGACNAMVWEAGRVDTGILPILAERVVVREMKGIWYSGRDRNCRH